MLRFVSVGRRHPRVIMRCYGISGCSLYIGANITQVSQEPAGMDIADQPLLSYIYGRNP